MPGKYPTIKAEKVTQRMPITPGPGADGIHVGYSLTNSDTVVLNSLFPNSPTYTTDPAAYRATVQALMLDGVLTENDQMGSVNLDYGNTPNLADVTTGGGGLPASPYFPNLASTPDPGDAGTQPAMSPEAIAQVTANDNWGSGVTIDSINLQDVSSALGSTSIVSEGPVGAQGQSSAHQLIPGALS